MTVVIAIVATTALSPMWIHIYPAITIGTKCLRRPVEPLEISHTEMIALSQAAVAVPEIGTMHDLISDALRGAGVPDSVRGYETGNGICTANK